jgi:hypothetical protein
MKANHWNSFYISDSYNVFGAAVNLAAFSSACPPLVAALRGVCNPKNPSRSCRSVLGIKGFSAVEMKDHDA